VVVLKGLEVSERVECWWRCCWGVGRGFDGVGVRGWVKGKGKDKHKHKLTITNYPKIINDS